MRVCGERVLDSWWCLTGALSFIGIIAEILGNCLATIKERSKGP